MKIKLSVTLLMLLLLGVPFTLSDNSDDIEPKYLDLTTIGYYQSTTCNISLYEFLIANSSNENNIYFNNNDYADINCFGKITGVDLNIPIKVPTNTSISLIIQSTLWFLLFFFIPQHQRTKDLNVYVVLLIPFIFCLQLFAEERYYSRTNILFENTLSFNNYYLLGNLIFYLLFGLMCFELLKTRYKYLINFAPFVFLFVGTFIGMNLNFYLVLLSYFGLNSLIKWRIGKYDYLYYAFSLVWTLNIQTNNHFFDGDKLKGFINSNLNIYSQIFWIMIFYLCVKGILYIVYEGIEFLDSELFLKNLLISSSLIVLFGFLGSNYSIFNFINFIFFGQNKRGMKSFESVDGNSWRGFSSSAESIGEFYGFVLLYLFLFYFLKKQKVSYKYFLLVIPILYGLYRSNNFASFLSLLTIITLFIIFRLSAERINPKKMFILLVLIFCTLFSLYLVSSDYQYLSSELLFESTLHQGFYENPGTYSNFKIIEQKMYERDLKTILLSDINLSEASSSYKFLVHIFTSNVNIPLLPNIVAIISVISLLINRTEMWGIFIAKYDPTSLDTIFGNGPQQLNNYLYKENIFLDVPKFKIGSLFLPHSSFLDYLIFFGVGGFGILLFIIFRKLYLSDKQNVHFYLTIYLLINFLKSDSILYLNSFILFVTTLTLLHNTEIENFYER